MSDVEIEEVDDSMNLDAFRDIDCDDLILKVEPRYARIFDRSKYSDNENRAIYRYLFSRKPKKYPPSMKNRLIGLYDPMADRSKRFPDGLRWCLNVYVGCEHNCGYCYVNGYSQTSVGISPHTKPYFEHKLIKLCLKRFTRPYAPPRLCALLLFVVASFARLLYMQTRGDKQTTRLKIKHGYYPYGCIS